MYIVPKTRDQGSPSGVCISDSYADLRDIERCCATLAVVGSAVGLVVKIFLIVENGLGAPLRSSTKAISERCMRTDLIVYETSIRRDTCSVQQSNSPSLIAF